MKMDEKFFKGYCKFVEKEKKLGGLDPEDAETLVKAHYEYIGQVLADNKSEDGFVLTLPEYVEYAVSHREGEDDSVGNFGISVTAGPELKKRIKDDASLEDEE